MKCDRCNYENDDDAKNCINCGAKMPQKPTIICHIQYSNQEQQNRDNQDSTRHENDYYLTQYQEEEPDNMQTPSSIIRKSNLKDNENHRNDNDYYMTNYRGPLEFEKNKPKKGKKLWVTIVLSILCVGLGQIYLKEYKKAFFFITVGILSTILATRYEVFFTIGIFNAIYQLLDAIKDYKEQYISE